MPNVHVLVSDGPAPGVDIARVAADGPAPTLTTEQLMTAMGLVDEILDCDARLHACCDGPRRPQLASLADRIERLAVFLDPAPCVSRRLRTP